MWSCILIFKVQIGPILEGALSGLCRPCVVYNHSLVGCNMPSYKAARSLALPTAAAHSPRRIPINKNAPALIKPPNGILSQPSTAIDGRPPPQPSLLKGPEGHTVKEKPSSRHTPIHPPIHPSIHLSIHPVFQLLLRLLFAPSCFISQ